MTTARALPGQRVADAVREYGASDADAALLLCDRHPAADVAFTIVAPDLSAVELTYGDLRSRSERVAGALAALGVGPGDRVATLMGKSAELVVTILAIWRLGAVHVPLFTAFAPPAVAARIGGNGTKAVVVDAAQRHKLDAPGDYPADASWRIVTLGEPAASDVAWADLEAGPPWRERVAVGGDGTLIEIFTSGTTGSPKGVPVPLRAVAAMACYQEFGLDHQAADVFWNAADPGWAYGLYQAVVGPMALGRTALLLAAGFSPELTWSVLRHFGVTNFAAGPTVYRALRSSEAPVPAGLVLRHCSSAGETLGSDVIAWAEQHLGSPILDHYGQTETGMMAANPWHPEASFPLRPGAMGRALPGWKLDVLALDKDEAERPGVVGRLAVDVVNSPLMWFTGYSGDAEATACRFKADGRWYLTGDTGSVDHDGYLSFAAREDDVILMAGYRIGPSEVENVLTGHPDVAEAAVVAAPDELRGEVLVAYVALCEGRTGSEALKAELQQLVKTRYAAHAYPREVHFLPALPRTPSGKVQRFLLRPRSYARLGISFDVEVRRDVRIPTSDPLVTLSADLFLPRDAGPVPVLLTVLPYRRDVAAMNGSPVERWFAAQGYASLLVDLQGSGSSDGEQRPPFDPGEADDALAAIGWAVEQPWCDGSVGMWGHSYGAMTSLRTAERRPAALKAVIASQGTADPHGEFTFVGGAAGAAMPLGIWGRNMLWGQWLPPLDDFDDEAEQARWRRRIKSTPSVVDLFRQTPDDAAGHQGSIDATAIEVPALFVAGWRDLFVDGTIRAFEQAAGPKKLVAGPWLHTMPQFSPTEPIDFLPIAKEWWDRWLRGVAAEESAPPVGVFVQGARPRWLGAAAWPLAEPAAWDLSRWTYDIPATGPDATVGMLSGLWATPDGPFGLPLDQHADDVRSLSLTSPVLDAPLLLGGRTVVEVETDWPQVSVKLADVDPAGRSTLICAGVSARGGRVELVPTAYEVEAGHRLRLAVAPADFPRTWAPAVPGQWPDIKALALPVADATATAPLGFAPPPPPDIPAELLEHIAQSEPPQASWEISEDHLSGTVSLRIATSFSTVPALNTHGRRHTVRVRQELLATGHRSAPERSTVTGTVTSVVETENGRRVTVEADVHADSSALSAAARIDLDGERIADLRWNA